jgi:predicted nucleotidyltransferase component of viral defense system
LRVSRERLIRDADATGFRPEVLEKALHLLALLEGFNRHPFLRDRIALKGGTALNLFLLDLPRLSVDIDLNYIGALDLETMQAERPRLEEALVAVCRREGLRVTRVPGEHAGGRFELRFDSGLGGDANLKLDINYMFRVPLWPPRRIDSHTLGRLKAKGIPVLDLHELAAGKLAALLARRASRDLFDAHQLLTTQQFERDRLRLAFVVYGALNRKDWRSVSPSHVHFNRSELRNELIPVLRRDREEDPIQSVQHLVKEVRAELGVVLPLTKKELAFLTRLLDGGEIEPALITHDDDLAEKIAHHPGLLWKALNVQRHKERSRQTS